MIEIAVLGFGNIGSGIVELIDTNRDQIERAVPEGIHVAHILDIRSFPQSPYADRITADFDVILRDPAIRIICEAMGGVEPAHTFTRKALEKGISVCTSNKELVESYGPELLQTAREHNCAYLFEASVGGGIPLLHPLIACLAQENITSIAGILNGTTNYILTKMELFGANYADALQEAQAKGYAERDPRADVEGHDTGRKIAILSSLMTGRTVRFKDLRVEGITNVSPVDFAIAGAMGCTIRLLGLSRMMDGRVSAMVAPFLIPADHMLASVQDVFNGVMVHGETVDDLMFYGRGAGKNPTASAVLSDVLNAVCNRGYALSLHWDSDRMPISEAGQTCYRRMIRIPAAYMKEAVSVFENKVAKLIEPISGYEERALITTEISETEFEQLSSHIPAPCVSLRMLVTT